MSRDPHDGRCGRVLRYALRAPLRPRTAHPYHHHPRPIIRREVGPLQASVLGPVRATAPSMRAQGVDLLQLIDLPLGAVVYERKMALNIAKLGTYKPRSNRAHISRTGGRRNLPRAP